MKITIAHFYYDLLNLYGENGNVKILKQALEQAGCDVSIQFVTIDDTPNFDAYDIVYIGAGTEENQKIALEHLMQYQKEIQNAINQNKFFLITGNAIELFVTDITDKQGKVYNALNIFQGHAKEVEFRIVDEALFRSNLITEPILGFQNQGSVIKEIEHSLFQVVEGTGSYPNSKIEGIHQHEFYGTYLIGPLLVRNPKLLEYFTKKIITSKNPSFKIKQLCFPFAEQAYVAFMKRHYAKELEKH